MSDQIKQYQDKAQQFAADFDKQAIQRIPQLQKAQDAGARPVFIAAGATALLAAITMAIFGPLNALNICATLAPAAVCFMALHDGSAAQSHTQWLTYWCLFSTLSLFDGGLYEAAPFVYFIAKAAACVYLSAFHGAQFVYEKALVPAGDAIKKAVGAAQSATKSGSGKSAQQQQQQAPTTGKQPIHQSVDEQKETERTVGQVGT